MSKYIDKYKVLEYIIFGVVGKDITCGELTRAIESIPTIEVSEDCISREYLKSFGYINKGNFNSVETIREWIENAPSVVPSRAEGEWIPCSERLPDATGFYLCTVNRDAPNVRTMKFELLVGDEYRWLLMNGTKVFPRFVLAWMPLPKPWKGADNE